MIAMLWHLVAYYIIIEIPYCNVIIRSVVLEMVLQFACILSILKFKVQSKVVNGTLIGNFFFQEIPKLTKKCRNHGKELVFMP